MSGRPCCRAPSGLLTAAHGQITRLAATVSGPISLRRRALRGILVLVACVLPCMTVWAFASADSRSSCSPYCCSFHAACVSRGICSSTTSFAQATFIGIVRDRKLKTSVAALVLEKPPAPPITDVESGRKPKYAQCIVEYKDNSKAKGEGWLFHMEAATEDESRAEVKPSFLRLLRRSAHIWARNTTITCTSHEMLPQLGGPCAECVRFFTGGIYGGGVIVPAIDYKNPGKAAFGAEECLALIEQQPPKDGVPSETGGGSMSGHDTRMSPFCRTNTFPGFD
eukprot:TRINITY_DN56871_c0_g1_i1.p1 TRINITY_DN56871_c0_g1~~TRINITY_DN56871_c0_g1_i1.p1  ORF type:complete len:281 (-),score=20.13 TRINITY_DN56871_c0_g1_i1:228-1070(-)